MKKLKQMSGPYSIGFELSSTAHGFVATDPNGNVLYHGKQPVMGTRVFKEGQHAAEARMPRTSRRGIQRRRGREHEMERVFAPVISSIDPDFFIRRRMSYKLGKIRFESDPIGFSYSRLFHSFPTLAHLDVALMEADSAMDPRLIFEAVANHVVRRGHFLLENQNVSSTNSDIDTQVANYAEVLVSYFEDTLDERIELSLEALDINGNVTARELQKQFASAMCVSGDDIQKKTEKAQIKAIADLVAGYKADLTVLVPDAEKLPKVSISDGDALEEFLADSCPDSLVPVLMAAQALYTSWKLQGMLSYAPGKSLSHNQVAQHDVYGKQLRMLKDLALKYVAKQDANGNVDEDGFKDYVRFFGGPKREDGYRYDKVQVKKQDSPKNNMGYTAYNLNVLGYEEFAKRVELLFKDTDAVDDSQYKTMMEAFANHAFLRRIHTVDNAAIPYQLHAEVVNRIIDNQGRFYPWLIDAREHILKVLTSRIPYYVGPLDSTDHGKAGENGTRFAWVKRLAGHEDAFVSPWNYEDHIDIDTTAELFIRRMTGECSYLDGEDVLAKNSLLYEKYCFFNELASLSFTEDGDSWMPFDAGMRRAIYDAASDGKTMTVKRIESCWRKCPPDKLMIVSGLGQTRSVSGKGTFVIPGLQRVDTLALGAVQVQLSTENEIPTQDAILIHACAVANFQIGQTPELIEIASKNYLNMDKAEMTRQVTEVMLGKMREVIGQMDLKELMRDRESFNHKVFEGSRDDLANLGLELRTFNVQDFSDSQGIIRSMGADQAAEIKKEAELAQIRAEQEVAERQNQLDLKKAELKKTADKAAAEADMVKQTVTAEKQRELYVAQQEAQIAAETKKVELAERQVAVKERELDATVRKQAEADRYAAEQKADAELYTRTKNAEAAKVEAQNKSDADLYSAQKTAEAVSAKAKAEAEATRLKGEADGAAEKAHGEGVAAGIKAQTEAYNGMENAYLLANRYIDVMPEVAEAVAKPLTAVDSIKMYGDGNATKLVRDTTGMVDQVTSGLKDATGIDLTELLSSFHQPFQPREDNE